jgi:hypothetical protein
MLEKIKYLTWSIMNLGSSKNCPSCDSHHIQLIQRKYLFTSLRECSNCKLRFRIPLEKFRNSSKFYQENYNEPDGITTYIQDKELNGDLDFGYKLLTFENQIIFYLLNKKPTELSILDFGSSWGYQSYQFKKIGYLTSSFEISLPRLNYGNNRLGLNITNNIEKVPIVDIFYSSHVIEHLENPKLIFDIAVTKTHKNGLVYLKCPNGSEEFKLQHPLIYKQMWGMVHPNFISKEWLEFVLNDLEKIFFVSSSEDNLLMSEIKQWDRTSTFIGPLDSPNLTILFFN